MSSPNMRYPLTASERERRGETGDGEVDEEDDGGRADGGEPHAARRAVLQLLRGLEGRGRGGT